MNFWITWIPIFIGMTGYFLASWSPVVLCETPGVFSQVTMNQPGKKGSRSWLTIWLVWSHQNEKIVPVSRYENTSRTICMDLKVHENIEKNWLSSRASLKQKRFLKSWKQFTKIKVSTRSPIYYLQFTLYYKIWILTPVHDFWLS